MRIIINSVYILYMSDQKSKVGEPLPAALKASVLKEMRKAAPIIGDVAIKCGTTRPSVYRIWRDFQHGCIDENGNKVPGSVRPGKVKKIKDKIDTLARAAGQRARLDRSDAVRRVVKRWARLDERRLEVVYAHLDKLDADVLRAERIADELDTDQSPATQKAVAFNALVSAKIKLYDYQRLSLGILPNMPLDPSHDPTAPKGIKVIFGRADAVDHDAKRERVKELIEFIPGTPYRGAESALDDEEAAIDA